MPTTQNALIIRGHLSGAVWGSVVQVSNGRVAASVRICPTLWNWEFVSPFCADLILMMR